jgi:hypothetical protein
MNNGREYIHCSNGLELPYFNEFGDELLYINNNLMPIYSDSNRYSIEKRRKESWLGLLFLPFMFL